MKNANDYIEWFWTEWIKIKNTQPNDEDGLCSCEFDIFIKNSSRPDQMRAFLLIGTLIDQMMYTHFKNIYDKFRLQYKYPKIYSHGGPGMASPSYFFLPLCGAAAAAAHAALLADPEGKSKLKTIFFKSRSIKPVVRVLFSGLYGWLSIFSDSDEEMYIRRFKHCLVKEIRQEYGKQGGEAFQELIQDFI